MPTPLLASIGALFIGPVLFRFAAGKRAAMSALDGFVLVTIGGLVFLDFLPHSVLIAGRWALVSAGVGLLAPGAAERFLMQGNGSRWGRVIMGLALLGLILHDFLDGAVVGGHADPDHVSGNLLALGVILHRIPVGLAIWGLVRPTRGVAPALGLLGLIIVATMAGTWFSAVVFGSLAGQGLAMMQALVAGSLLHVVNHALPLGEQCEVEHPVAAGAGALAGIALLYGLSELHPVVHQVTGELGAGRTFLTLSLESAPALLLALLIAAAIHLVLRPPDVLWLAKDSRPFRGAWRGLLLGIPLALSSADRPALHRLVVRSDVPPAASATLLAFAPGSAIPGLLLSLVFLGGAFAGLRLVLGAAFAMLVGLLTAAVAKRGAPPVVEQVTWPSMEPPPHLGLRLVRFAGTSMIERSSPWTLVGILAAAIMEPVVAPNLLHGLGLWTVPAMALLGLPIHLSATGAVPLVAVLLHKGISPGAAMAFLLTGPSANVHTLRSIASTYGRRAAVVFAGSIIATATVLGLLANAILPATPSWQLHEHSARTPSLLSVIALALLASLTLAALLRRGPRGLLGQLGLAHGHDSSMGEPAHAQ